MNGEYSAGEAPSGSTDSQFGKVREVMHRKQLWYVPGVWQMLLSPSLDHGGKTMRRTQEYSDPTKGSIRAGSILGAVEWLPPVSLVVHFRFAYSSASAF